MNKQFEKLLSGLDCNPEYKKELLDAFQQALQEQREIVESFKFMPYDDESLSCTELFANKVLDDVITQLKK